MRTLLTLWQEVAAALEEAEVDELKKKQQERREKMVRDTLDEEIVEVRSVDRVTSKGIVPCGRALRTI